jgi:hypothetical protein
MLTRLRRLGKSLHDEARRDQQFLQTDPVGWVPDMNWYAYVQGDPINRGDPGGLADVNYTTEFDPPSIRAAGQQFDLPNTTTILAHGPAISRRSGRGDRDFTRVRPSALLADVRRLGGRGEPIFLGACRCGSANAALVEQLSRLDGDRAVMAATSQVWYSFNEGTGTFTVTAFWKTAEGRPGAAGEFQVTNGSFEDFGIEINPGERLRGFEANIATGQVRAIVGISRGAESRLPERTERRRLREDQ